MKNSKHTIRNRSRDLPFWSSVPQPLRYRVPIQRHYYTGNYNQASVLKTLIASQKQDKNQKSLIIVLESNVVCGPEEME
jgi:hypothetical protein